MFWRAAVSTHFPNALAAGDFTSRTEEALRPPPIEEGAYSSKF